MLKAQCHKAPECVSVLSRRLSSAAVSAYDLKLNLSRLPLGHSFLHVSTSSSTLDITGHLCSDSSTNSTPLLCDASTAVPCICRHSFEGEKLAEFAVQAESRVQVSASRLVAPVAGAWRSEEEEEVPSVRRPAAL